MTLDVSKEPLMSVSCQCELSKRRPTLWPITAQVSGSTADLVFTFSPSGGVRQGHRHVGTSMRFPSSTLKSWGCALRGFSMAGQDGSIGQNMVL